MCLIVSLLIIIFHCTGILSLREASIWSYSNYTVPVRSLDTPTVCPDLWLVLSVNYNAMNVTQILSELLYDSETQPKQKSIIVDTKAVHTPKHIIAQSPQTNTSSKVRLHSMTVMSGVAGG